ncbi:hypothetical protein MQE36_15810 [Zhouia spongiae]|uniref:HEAT repeat domain-containing protein n=1 Tax=Zhouia spongiae TaxID=2202721 RepID=A0ABY3YL32_9FLAO|nr:hypothetical protein [Zhouia spongiae]UNY98532.1 hypothetical protein MQE36_15810 [Zhouia spongiae]
MNFKEKILNEKQLLIDKIILEISNTEDVSERDDLVVLAIENFNDPGIGQLLVDLVKNEARPEKQSIYLNTCRDYPYALEACKAEIPFLVNLLIHGEYETTMSAAELLLQVLESNDLDEGDMLRAESSIQRFLSGSYQGVELKAELERILND